MTKLFLYRMIDIYRFAYDGDYSEAYFALQNVKERYNLKRQFGEFWDYDPFPEVLILVKLSCLIPIEVIDL